MKKLNCRMYSGFNHAISISFDLSDIYIIYILYEHTLSVHYDVRYDFRIQMIFGSSLPPVICRKAHVLCIRYLCLFAYGGVQHTLCCVFVLVFFRLVYPMLPVSLHCPFLIAPSVFSNLYYLNLDHRYLDFSRTYYIFVY